MLKQINKDNVEQGGSVLGAQDTTLTSENNSRVTESDPILEAKVVKKKSFSKRWKTNRFWLVRGSYFVLNSIWMAVMAIGAFIVWIIAMLFI